MFKVHRTAPSNLPATFKNCGFEFASAAVVWKMPWFLCALLQTFILSNGHPPGHLRSVFWTSDVEKGVAWGLCVKGKKKIKISQSFRTSSLWWLREMRRVTGRVRSRVWSTKAANICAAASRWSHASESSCTPAMRDASEEHRRRDEEGKWSQGFEA